MATRKAKYGGRSSRRSFGAMLLGAGVMGGMPAIRWFRRMFSASSEGQERDAQKGKDAVSEKAALTQKPVLAILSATEKHWVGDGFAVNTIFSPSRIDPQIISPFILMDHARPRVFSPSDKPRGVGEHPHRGFETVTFAYQGEVTHRDSHGGGGTIGSGDVQWMTAGSGVVHEEFHSEQFTKMGGLFEMVQLWVNLPASLKMTAPRYQALTATTFPALAFGDATGRLIAGTLQNQTGPAKTWSDITMFDMHVPAGADASYELRLGHTVLMLVLEGALKLPEEQAAVTGDVVVFDRDKAGAVSVTAKEDTRILVLSGAPLGEPVVAHGPFVMNTREEIIEAIHDFQKGLMGTLAPSE